MDKRTLLIKLRALATYVEVVQQDFEATVGEASYDQMAIMTVCGSPGCMIGHSLALTNMSETSKLEIALAKISLIDGLPVCEQYEGDCDTAFHQLLGNYGCDDARDDWRKAVKYVRDWCDIYEKQEA